MSKEVISSEPSTLARVREWAGRNWFPLVSAPLGVLAVTALTLQAGADERDKNAGFKMATTSEALGTANYCGAVILPGPNGTVAKVTLVTSVNPARADAFNNAFDSIMTERDVAPNQGVPLGMTVETRDGTTYIVAVPEGASRHQERNIGEGEAQGSYFTEIPELVGILSPPERVTITTDAMTVYPHGPHGESQRVNPLVTCEILA